MTINLLSQYILPVLGFTSVLVMYSLILAKRYQKKLILSENYEQTGRTPNIYKITDKSESLWWNLTITIIFLSYFGLVILFFSQKNSKTYLLDAILWGFVMWSIIAYIGYRITREN